MTKTVFIAGGVGSFQPRTLKVDGLEKFDGTQLHYRVRNPAQFAGKNLVIVGGGDSALDWALNFAQDGPHKAESVILVHRRDGFRAAPASVAKMKELCDAYEMQFVVGQVTGFEEDAGRSRA
jgi:thioredoxin reductase (NADPH)